MSNPSDTTSERMGTLFNDFLSAAKALERLPQMEQQVNAAICERELAEANAERLFEDNQRLRDRNDELRLRIAELEASLDAATKSERGAKDNLDFLLKAVRNLTNEASEAVELVAPTAQAPQEPTPVETVPVPPTFDATTQTSAGSVGSSGNIEIDSSFIQQPQSSEAPSSDTAPVPFASSTDAPSPTVDPGSTESPVEPSAAASLPDYEAKAYWNKPSHMTWEDWTSTGGQLAPWVIPR